MANIEIGSKVRYKSMFEGDTCKLEQGKVRGFGYVEDRPVVLVRLCKGDYIENDWTKTYVSTVIVDREAVEVIE